MNSRFDQLTKGLLSLAVIIMFTAALIAGQARASLPVESDSVSEIGENIRTGIILDTASLRKFDSLSNIVGAILALPAEVELCIDVLTPRTSDSRSDNSTVQ